MASVKRYRHVGSRIMETIEPNDGEYVLASDYDRLVEVCRELAKISTCFCYAMKPGPCSNCEKVAKALALIGEGGEEGK